MLGEEQHEVATMGEGNIAVAVGMKNVSSLSLSRWLSFSHAKQTALPTYLVVLFRHTLETFWWSRQGRLLWRGGKRVQAC